MAVLRASINQNNVEIIGKARTHYQIKGIGISAPEIIQKDGFILAARAIKTLYGENFKQKL